MLKNLKSETIDKHTIVNEYVSAYIKLLPIRDDNLNKSINLYDNVLKQEHDIYINKSNEYVEK